MRHVEIQTSGDQSIEGSLFLAPGQRKATAGVLFLHGWGSGRDPHYATAERLADAGFVCLGVDLRGHGKTDRLARAVRATDNLADALAAHDFLASQPGMEDHPMGVAGFSYGGYLAVLLSRSRELRWLALRSPAIYRDGDLDIPKCAIDRNELARFRRTDLGRKDSIALATAAEFKGDVLVLESEYDSIVPQKQVQSFLNAFERARSLEHIVIPQADHELSNDRWKQIARETLVKWFVAVSRK